MQLSFKPWSAILNNVVVEVLNFSGFQIGRLNSICEVPGLLAVIIFLIIDFFREQTLACY